MGQALILQSAAESACNQLVPTGGNARYLVTVFSDALSQNTTNAFELAGNPASASTTVATVRMPTASLSTPATLSANDAALARRERVHLSALERMRTDFETLMPRARAAAGA